MSESRHSSASRLFKPSTLVLACVAALPSLDVHAELAGLGDLAGGTRYSVATGVSADGLVVVGESDAGNTTAYRWTTAGGMNALGIPGSYSAAYGISADAGVIVGHFDNGGHMEAFRWTPSGMTALGVGGYTTSQAMAVSADGATVVGGVHGAGQSKAFVWTEAGGLRLLDYLPSGAPNAYAYGVSGDGARAVGSSRLAIGGDRAVRWDTATGAASNLGVLAGGGWSQARGISADGQVIIGVSENAAGDSEAFRWTQAGGIIGLGSLSGHADTSASATSADGSVIVGQASNGTSEVAFYWRQATGMRRVQDWLSDDGVDVGTWRLTAANGVSADGQTVVGTGYNPAGDVEAFIARPGVLVGSSDLSASVASLGEISRLTSEWERAAIATDIPGLSGLIGWSVAPVYQHVAGSRGDSGGVALTWRRPGLAIAGRAGVLDARTGSVHAGGGGRFNGAWLGLGASLDLADTLERGALDGLELEGGLHYGRYDAEIRRNYLNGATPETALGNTGSDELTILARLAWRYPLSRNLQILPHLQWRYDRGVIDAYDETGGVLAGRVSDLKRENVEMALGATLSWQVRPELELRTHYRLHHSDEREGTPVNVVVPGLGSIAHVDRGRDANWHELGLGLEWAVNRRIWLNAQVSTTRGSDSPEGWNAGLAVNFSL